MQTRRRSHSEAQHQFTDRRRLRQERVVDGAEFDGVAGSTGELALPLGVRAPVLGADEVRRGRVVPGRLLHRLFEDGQALLGRLVEGLALDLGIAVV